VVTIRVLMVDDHRLFAEAMAHTVTRVGMTVVGIATSANEARAEARETRPDMVLVDVGLPDQDGVELGKEILEELPNTKVVALTARDDGESVRDAFRAGFHGYLTKNIDPGRFTRALESVFDGNVVFPDGAATRSAHGNARRSAADLLADQLTTRELDVLRLLVEGASSREIADRLAISHNTVRTHVQGILTKLQVHSRLEAAAFAVRNDLLDLRS
jgi:two-component system, NarL family, nitrate/nitrite response regulator NarL